MLEGQDLIDFSISAWYAKFSHLTGPVIILPIPESLLEKFKSFSTDTEVISACSIEYFTKLQNAVQHFGGEAFVKDNWKAPMDAKILSFGHLLKVTSVNELFLFLTSSQIICHNFTYEKVDEFCISIRKWVNIHPASEFRCVIVNNVLRAITPRDWPTFYIHFKEEGHKIIALTTEYFLENIKNKFPRQNFVFDVYINFPDEITLVDFGPLNYMTTLYAFHWREIQLIMHTKKNFIEDPAPVFRYLEQDVGIVTKAVSLYETIIID